MEAHCRQGTDDARRGHIVHFEETDFVERDIEHRLMEGRPRYLLIIFSTPASVVSIDRIGGSVDDHHVHARYDDPFRLRDVARNDDAGRTEWPDCRLSSCKLDWRHLRMMEDLSAIGRCELQPRILCCVQDGRHTSQSGRDAKFIKKAIDVGLLDNVKPRKIQSDVVRKLCQTPWF